MLDALMSQLPEDSLVIHTSELINSGALSHSRITEKCNSVPTGEGSMPLNNSYPRDPEHLLSDAEHAPGTYAPSQEVDQSAFDVNKLSLGNDSEEPDQIHANGYTPGKNYLPKQKSENSFDSMVVMLDGMTSALSSSQSSSTDRLSVTPSEGSMLTSNAVYRMDNEDQNVKVDRDGVVENGTKDGADIRKCEVVTDIQELETAADDGSSNSLSRVEVSPDQNKAVETATDIFPSNKNHPTSIESSENPQPSDKSQPGKPTEHSSIAEDLDGMEAVELSSTDGASEASKLEDDSSRAASESNTASTLELRSSESVIGDQLVDSILKQMEDEDGEGVVLRRKEMRPNSVRLSAISLGGQGVAGCSTPVGRVGNFGGIGDELDLDETDFVEINLQSHNSENRSTSDRPAVWESNSASSFASKTSRLGSFLVR